MKTCKECGLEYEDNFLFCTEDGTALAPGGLIKGTGQEAAELSEPGGQAAKAPVLYCPACGAEYPLTFSNCAVDGLKLTHVPPFASPAPVPTVTAQEDPTDDPGPASETKPLDPQGDEGSDLLANKAASHHPEARRTDSPDIRGYEIEEFDYDSSQVSISPDPEQPNFRIIEVDYDADYEDFPEVSPGPDPGRPASPERPSFRVAAKGLIIGLALFALAALYVIYNSSTRRPTASSLKNPPRSEAAEQSLPFIPTPQAAREYKEETAQPNNQDGSVQPQSREDNKEHNRTEPKRGEDRSPPVVAESKPKPQDQPSDRPRITSPTVTAQTPARSADISAPVRHVATEGRVNSRLVRVRARKTPAGYRYDLTFNLQEQAGHALYWNRLSISTISASGRQHVEAIPFPHRLGASGLLTFTVSVEMRGSKEADWQGRIVCTSLGSDDVGKPIRATFGANVSP